MKTIRTEFLFMIISALITTASFAQSGNPMPNYDAALAKRTGADQYGMKIYIMAILKEGPNQIKDSVERNKLQMAHLKNIMRLAKEGKLIIAGPFLNDESLRGIFVFNVSSIEEAKQLTETDPAIQAGELIMELHTWYGSAAMTEIPALHKKVQKKSIVD